MFSILVVGIDGPSMSLFRYSCTERDVSMTCSDLPLGRVGDVSHSRDERWWNTITRKIYVVSSCTLRHLGSECLILIYIVALLAATSA